MFAIVYQLYSSTVFPVSCSDKLLQSKLIEVNLKIPDEVGLSCIVAVAIDYFVFEVLAVMPDLVFYILKLREKFVVFRFLCTVKIAVI